LSEQGGGGGERKIGTQGMLGMYKEIGKNSSAPACSRFFISLFAFQLPPFLLLPVKVFHGLALSYISDPIRVKPVRSRYSLRSADKIYVTTLSLLQLLNCGTSYPHTKERQKLLTV